jgi:hypothetical protein
MQVRRLVSPLVCRPNHSLLTKQVTSLLTHYLTISLLKFWLINGFKVDLL